MYPIVLIIKHTFLVKFYFLFVRFINIYDNPGIGVFRRKFSLTITRDESSGIFKIGIVYFVSRFGFKEVNLIEISLTQSYLVSWGIIQIKNLRSKYFLYSMSRFYFLLCWIGIQDFIYQISYNGNKIHSKSCNLSIFFHMIVNFIL